jgi:hypothetical protein
MNNKRKSVFVFAIFLVLATASITAASPYHSSTELSNGKVRIAYTNEAVGMANYTDDSLEPGGWDLFPSVYWDGNGNSMFENGESVASTIFPVLHFTKDSQQYSFAPLHQSIMAQGDAQVTSSGWVSAPNVYASEVKDPDNLVRLKSTISIFSGNSYFKQEIAVKSTASATLTGVTLIVYVGIDINGFFDDQAFIDASENNMIKAHDTKTGTWLGAYPTVPADNCELSEFDDGPSQNNDAWQHCLANNLNGQSTASGDVEGALQFSLPEIAPNNTRTITIYYSLGPNESALLPFPADVNGDHYVNAKDAVILGKAFGTRVGDPLYNASADINKDGFCNAKDAIILGKYFGQGWT